MLSVSVLRRLGLKGTRVLLAVALPASIAFSQDYPKVDVFGGYSYASADFASAGHNSLNGWNGSFTANFNRGLGVTADFGGLYGADDVSSVVGAPCPPFCGQFKVNSHAYTFLFGPQLSLRLDRLTPFFHGLIGTAHVTESVSIPFVPPSPTPTVSFSDTSFATALGGGADFRLTQKFAWRVQADYLQTRVFNGKQNNFRMSTGIVFHF